MLFLAFDFDYQAAHTATASVQSCTARYAAHERAGIWGHAIEGGIGEVKPRVLQVTHSEATTGSRNGGCTSMQVQVLHDLPYGSLH